MTDQYLPTNINAPRRTVTVAATTTLGADASLVIVNTVGLGAAPTITLPDAREVDGLTVIVKAPVATVGSGGQNVNVVGTGGQTIDGAATVTLAVDQTALTVKSDNANWQIVCLTDANSGGEIIFGDLFLDAASPTLTIGNGTGSPALVLNKSDAGTAVFNMQVAGITRWDWLFDAAEDLSLERRNGAGVLVDVPISFDIAAGNVAILNQILQGGAAAADGFAGSANAVFGDGSTDAGITVFCDSVAGEASITLTDTTGVSIAGMRYTASSDTVRFRTSGTDFIELRPSGELRPVADGGAALGQTARRWTSSFISQISYNTQVVGDGGTIALGASKIVQATAPTAATTLTLPTAVLGNDYFIDIVDSTSNILIVAAAGDTINGGAAAGTATIAAGAEGLYHIYAVDVTDWRLHGPIALGPASA